MTRVSEFSGAAMAVVAGVAAAALGLAAFAMLPRARVAVSGGALSDVLLRRVGGADARAGGPALRAADVLAVGAVVMVVRRPG